MDEKEIFLKEEGNAWYRRNKDTLFNRGEIAQGFDLIAQFLKEQHIVGRQHNILEIGCSYGYNLAYLNTTLKTKCYGIEPSDEAVNYGNSKFRGGGYDISLIQGTSDLLPYDDEMFDVVIMGFCLFWVGRKYLFRTVGEADRVLKSGGYLIIIDFDTAIPYKRNNLHNSQVYTYKMQYANLFLANPCYYLVNKKSYSHKEMAFHKDIQERISLEILYKEDIDTIYQRG